MLKVYLVLAYIRYNQSSFAIWTSIAATEIPLIAVLIFFIEKFQNFHSKVKKFIRENSDLNDFIRNPETLRENQLILLNQAHLKLGSNLSILNSFKIDHELLLMTFSLISTTMTVLLQYELSLKSIKTGIKLYNANEKQ